MCKSLPLLLIFTASFYTFGPELQAADYSEGDCLFGCDTLMKWMHRRNYETILAPIEDEESNEAGLDCLSQDISKSRFQDNRQDSRSSDHSSYYTDSDCGYETDLDDSSKLVKGRSPIDLSKLGDDPKVLDKIIPRFYDLVMTHGVKNKSNFYEMVIDPKVNFWATKKMYYACCNFDYEGRRYRGVSYRTILKKVSKIVEDPFFGFYFVR